MFAPTPNTLRSYLASKNDLEALVTFAAQIATKERISRRQNRTSDLVWNPPRVSGDPGLALDAIARLCVRKRSGELIAVSMRLEATTGALYVASNDNVVPQPTQRFLQNLLYAMEHLSRATAEQSQELTEMLLYIAITHGFSKWSHTLTKIAGKLDSYVTNRNVLRRNHPLAAFLAILDALQGPIARFTQQASAQEKHGAVYELGEKVALAFGDRLRCLALHEQRLKHLWTSADLFKRNRFVEKYLGKPGSRTTFEELSGDMAEIVSLVHDVERLVYTAKCRKNRTRIFEKNLAVVAVDDTLGQQDIGNLPASSKGWLKLLEKSVAARNDANDRYGLKASHLRLHRVLAKKACQHVASSSTTKANDEIHPELKLIHFLHQENEQTTTGKAIGYIGCSKKSCIPCFAFVDVYNEHMGTRFETSGRQERFRGPWAVPDLHGEVGGGLATKIVRETFARVSGEFLRVWDGLPEGAYGSLETGTAAAPMTLAGEHVERALREMRRKVETLFRTGQGQLVR